MIVFGGKTVKEVADQLSLSVKTISTYRSRIFGEDRDENDRGTSSDLLYQPNWWIGDV